jgi:hypothetical protein
MVEVISGQARDFDADFVHVCCKPLASSVRDEAVGWIRAIASGMRDLDVAALAALQARMAAWRAVLGKLPSSLDELKEVLQTVDTIRWGPGSRGSGRRQVAGAGVACQRHAFALRASHGLLRLQGRASPSALHAP